jgi:hypothetical protein
VLYNATDTQSVAKALIARTHQVSSNILKYKKLKSVEEFQYVKSKQIHKQVHIRM